MDRAVAPGLVLLAACFSPAPPPGAPCEVDERCPSPFACIDGVCREPAGPTTDGGVPVQCPAAFVRMPSGSCHLDIFEPTEWPAAELDCEQRGGHLAVPDGPAEAAELRNPRWIGISDRVSESTYRAVTGAIISFANWETGQPSGSFMNCVHTGSQARWQDGPCEFPFSYVCEYDGLPADPGAY